MSNVLDAILRVEMIGSKEGIENAIKETLDSTGNSIDVDISGAEGGFIIQLDYDNGVSPSIVLSLEVSVDGLGWVPLDTGIYTVTDSDGVAIWDIINTNANFVRINYEVSSGSIDAFAVLSAKRRH